MNARALAAGAALALLLPAPAARAGVDNVAGTTCSLVGTVEQAPPSQEEQKPRVEHHGWVTSGPWVTTRAGGRVISVTCTFQVGSDDPAAPDLLRVSAAGGYLPPSDVSFATSSAEPVFLCTEVVVHNPPSPPDPPRHYDADPGKPGAQCQKAERREGSMAVFEIAPSSAVLYGCVYAEDENLPRGYVGGCNPLDP